MSSTQSYIKEKINTQLSLIKSYKDMWEDAVKEHQRLMKMLADVKATEELLDMYIKQTK